MPEAKTSATTGQAKMTKNEAVRRAVRAIGRHTPLAQLQKYIKEHFDISMSTNHISTSRGDMFRKKGKKGGQRGRKPGAAQAPAAASAAPAKGGSSASAIVLDDVLTVKKLVDRVGPDQLRVLIDTMTK
jgi:hypothetical protein